MDDLRASRPTTLARPRDPHRVELPGCAGHGLRDRADVADDLLGRVLLLEAAGARAAIVTLDVWGISKRFATEVAERVSVAAGVEPALIWVGVSGNASSPPLWEDDAVGYNTYADYVPQQIGGAAALAALRLEDAELGFAAALLPDLATSVYGRALDIDETVPVMVIDGVAGPIARVIGSQLVETGPFDPMAFTVAIGLLSITGFAAGAFPAWRATRVDPAEALRAD